MTTTHPESPGTHMIVSPGGLDSGTGTNRQFTGMYQLSSAGPPPGIRIATGPRIPVMREQLRGEQNERKPGKARSQAVLELR
jgi:hypothetical protein